jgi:hypothetical protein
MVPYIGEKFQHMRRKFCVVSHSIFFQLLCLHQLFLGSIVWSIFFPLTLAPNFPFMEGIFIGSRIIFSEFREEGRGCCDCGDTEESAANNCPAQSSDRCHSTGAKLSANGTDGVGEDFDTGKSSAKFLRDGLIPNCRPKNDADMVCSAGNNKTEKYPWN